MGKGRPFSASTQFKMIIHTNGNHRYASTKPYTIGEDGIKRYTYKHWGCLLYTSDAADDLLCVDLGGRRIIKKKINKIKNKKK